jgi:hypothetical protein
MVRLGELMMILEWRALGHDIPRGTVFSSMSFVRAWLELFYDLAAATLDGKIDLAAMARGNLDANAQRLSALPCSARPGDTAISTHPTLSPSMPCQHTRAKRTPSTRCSARKSYRWPSRLRCL